MSLLYQAAVLLQVSAQEHGQVLNEVLLSILTSGVCLANVCVQRQHLRITNLPLFITLTQDDFHFTLLQGHITHCLLQTRHQTRSQEITKMLNRASRL